MSRAERVVKRVVEDRLPIERCDQCGTEVELVIRASAFSPFFESSPPPTWFRLYTPDDRELSATGAIAGLAFCSAFCLAKFARGLCVTHSEEVGQD